jgi:bifunctional non-homologous end joining protein LigD
MPDRLDAYRRKRSFSDTPEPDGPQADADATELRFVVHEHHATRLHWDLRLEHDGALASWAVPNGIPQDPKKNRKAIHVEDHPIDYLEFEGTIPDGNYGAGGISVWDRGTFTVEKWRADEVIVVFHGEKLQGKYALFQAGKVDKDWLLHRMDPPLDPDAEPIPDMIKPMLASPAKLPAKQDEWAFEVKWDGVRAVVRSEPGRFHLFGRSGIEYTKAYPELYHLNRALSSHSAILDGELIAFDPETGRQSFQAVQQRIHVSSPTQIKRLAAEAPVTLMIFDLLWLDGHSLMDLPYEERRARLDALDLGSGEHWQVPAFHVGDGTALLAATEEQQLEGVIAKRLGSVYEPGARAAAWRKIKNTRRQEVVIGGFTPGRRGRSGSLGALQVGVYDDEGDLVHAGGVGSGFTEALLRDLMQRLEPLEQDDSPFTGRQPPKETRFVRPELVCEVTFAEWSRDGSLRHPVFQGLRDDKPARDVVREVIGAEADQVDFDDDDTEGEVEPETFGAPGARSKGTTPPLKPARRRVNAATSATPAAAPERPVIDGASVTVEHHRIKLTNLDKVLYPATGTTKREVIEYYAAIAPVLAPHLSGRPLTLKRYPDGVESKAFFEKHANRYRPDWVNTVEMPAGSKTIDFVEVSDLATLVWLGNLAAIELHPSLSKAPHAEQPTMLVFDLDPGPGTTVVECCTVGLEIRELLDQLDLDCWAKTSGSKGLQLYAPLNVDVTYDDTKPFAQAVASLLEQRHPDLVVSRMKKSLRPGKVLIDWSQNDAHKTTVSVYSLRARETPTVSTPVTWDEVEACASAGDDALLRFDKEAVLARVAEHGDLFAPVLTLEQDLPALGRG